MLPCCCQMWDTWSMASWCWLSLLWIIILAKYFAIFSFNVVLLLESLKNHFSCRCLSNLIWLLHCHSLVLLIKLLQVTLSSLKSLMVVWTSFMFQITILLEVIWVNLAQLLTNIACEIMNSNASLSQLKSCLTESLHCVLHLQIWVLSWIVENASIV